MKNKRDQAEEVEESEEIEQNEENLSDEEKPKSLNLLGSWTSYENLY